MTLPLSSPQNPKVKHAIQLRDRRDRNLHQQFLIEGFRELTRAREGAVHFEVLFFCPEFFLGSNENALIAALDCLKYQCTPQLFKKLSYRDRPDGLLAIAQQRHRDLHDLEVLLKGFENPFLVIAESIEKPGNLGTILRSCDAMGVDALLLCDQCTDLFNPNTVRASVGTLFTLPVIECGSEEAITFLESHHIPLIAATPEGDLPLWKEPLNGSLAVALGREQCGLSELFRKQCDRALKIPMLGHSDSLNVAMATTIMLYEIRRQRNEKIH